MRRDNKRYHYSRQIIAIALIAGVIWACIPWIKSQMDPDRRIEKFEVSAYMENSNAVRGNTYKISAEVCNDLAYSPTQGRMFSFVMQDSSVIPIMIPISLNRINIQKGQHYVLIVKIKDNGLIEAIKLTKA